MGPLGWEETVFIFVLALLLFGPKKLPELGRTLGKAMTEFRRASSELKASFDREMKSLEQETESLRDVTSQYQYDTHNYDYSSYETNYEGSYAYDHDSTAASSSTESASAIEGAESPLGHRCCGRCRHSQPHQLQSPRSRRLVLRPAPPRPRYQGPLWATDRRHAGRPRLSAFGWR